MMRLGKSIQWIFVAIALLLAACSAMNYQEPQSGPRARVRFSTDTTLISVLRQYQDRACGLEGESEMMRLRNGMLATSTPKRMGIPLWHHHENAAKEVYVEAGKRFYALFTSAESTGASVLNGTVTHTFHRCGVPFSFVFEAGQDYEVAFSHARCTVQVLKIMNLPGHAPEAVPQPVGAMDGPGCDKAFRKERAG